MVYGLNGVAGSVGFYFYFSFYEVYDFFFLINFAIYDDSIGLVYGDFYSGICSCSYSIEEACLMLGLALEENAVIFLWL